MDIIGFSIDQTLKLYVSVGLSFGFCHDEPMFVLICRVHYVLLLYYT